MSADENNQKIRDPAAEIPADETKTIVHKNLTSGPESKMYPTA